MVRQSEGRSNDLKRKWSIAALSRQDQIDDEVSTDRRRARLEFEHESDEEEEEEDEEEDEYTSATDDEDDEDDEDDVASSSSSSPVSPINRSSDDGCTSPRPVVADPERKQDSQRSRRKPSRPMKSPNPEDPKFKGVTVQFRTLINDNGEVQLMITAYFNCRKVSRRRCTWKNGCTSPSSTTENSDTPLTDVTSSYNTRRGRQGQMYHPSGKQCASCCTRKTPLWRDAEDGTPLCNACGIRYKKYRVRCGHCWFVPKKESKTNQICSNCGERFRYSMLRFKHSIM